MIVTYRMLADGGFVAGDLDSKITAYSYPEGLFAVTAKRNPLYVAERILEHEQALRAENTLSFENDYDRKNWMRLDGVEVPGEDEVSA